MLVTPPYFARLFYPEATWRKNTDIKKIYLTFDDGPIPEITEWVLHFLESENIKATFFCVGNNVELNPTIFQKVKDAGHKCCNHTFNHMSGWKTPNKEYFDNIEICDKYYSNKLFRPPHGRITLSQYSTLKKKYEIVFWDVISFDFDANTTPEKCLQNVTEHTRNGSVIVFHDSIKAKKNMQYALPLAVKFLKEQGYEFGLL
ncbi:MAG: polysaccharide deacetylase family protein [Bacteroidia bacterium]|nr:polysaccharide deacetylase family protein [Bacteroidia bacterium]